MKDDDLGKKLIEEEHLLQFLDAYKVATAIPLSLESRRESPDFICAYQSGERIGIELARSPHDYDMRVHDRLWTDRTVPNLDLLACIRALVASKERRRRTHGWPETILVVELIDYSFESLCWTDDSSHSEDFCDTGFREIWLADHSTIEAFGEIRLIGLCPPAIFGLHHQPTLDRKPHG